jgi:hypothetical protein
MQGIYIMSDGVTGCAWLRLNWATRCPVCSSALSCNELYDCILEHVTAAFFEAVLTCILFMLSSLPAHRSHYLSYLHTVHIIFLTCIPFTLSSYAIQWFITSAVWTVCYDSVSHEDFINMCSVILFQVAMLYYTHLCTTGIWWTL